MNDASQVLQALLQLIYRADEAHCLGCAVALVPDEGECNNPACPVRQGWKLLHCLNAEN